MTSLFNSTKNGYCRICGKYCKFSKDHIPPQKCFNDSTIYVNKPYQVKIDKGLKIKSVCQTCNNDILGGNFDNELKKFLLEIDKYIKLKIEKRVVFKEVIVKINKEKILKSILGHTLSCYGKQNELTDEIDLTVDCYTNRMRQYVLEKDDNFLDEISCIFWLHPYRTIKIIPNFILTELYEGKTSLGGSLFSFYPIGLFIINKNEYSLLKNYDLNEIVIDGNNEIKINMHSFQDEDFPFSILKRNRGICFIFDEKSIIHGIKSEYYSNTGLYRPGMF